MTYFAKWDSQCGQFWFSAYHYLVYYLKVQLYYRIDQLGSTLRVQLVFRQLYNVWLVICLGFWSDMTQISTRPCHTGWRGGGVVVIMVLAGSEVGVYITKCSWFWCQRYAHVFGVLTLRRRRGRGVDRLMLVSRVEEEINHGGILPVSIF